MSYANNTKESLSKQDNISSSRRNKRGNANTMSLASAINHANQGKSRIANKRGTGTSVTAGLELDNHSNSLMANSYDMQNQ